MMKDKNINIVIRPPQYGKTSICLETIGRQIDDVHIIMTMNTIKSNNQFFDRCNILFNNLLIVFNSKQGKKDTYANNVLDVKNLIIKKGKNIIIICAHPKRFKDSIKELIEELDANKYFKKKICIHIDEIHEYIGANRKNIEEWNDKDLVKDITGYTATPFKVWGSGVWQSIYVIECNDKFSSSEYFGVNDSNIILFSDIDKECVDINIPKKIENLCTGTTVLNQWYTNKLTYFDCGDEHTFLCYVKSVLYHLKYNGYIIRDEFSYNFIPAYKRKVTHLAIAFIICEIFPESVIFVFNGDKKHGNHYMHKNILYKIPENNETAKQIEIVREKFHNSPFFVTGFETVGMSVTLINQELGNFDNVIFSHEHYVDKRPELLYQLCRFLFRFSGWSEIAKKKIKHTKIWVSNQGVITTCLNYEKDVVNAEKMEGSLRTIEEMTDKFISLREKRVPDEKKHSCISQYANVNIKKFPVYDKSMENVMWEIVIKQYEKVKKHSIYKHSIPSKNANGFYEHSFSTSSKGVFTDEEINKKISNMSFHSNYQLFENCFEYARIYIGYYKKTDPNSYVIFLRTMTLENNDIVSRHLSTISCLRN